MEKYVAKPYLDCSQVTTACFDLVDAPCGVQCLALLLAAESRRGNLVEYLVRHYIHEKTCSALLPGSVKVKAQCARRIESHS